MPVNGKNERGKSLFLQHKLAALILILFVYVVSKNCVRPTMLLLVVWQAFKREGRCRVRASHVAALLTLKANWFATLIVKQWK